MATYYRWRKSTVNYQNDSISLSVGTIISEGNNFVYQFSSRPSINQETGTYTLSDYSTRYIDNTTSLSMLYFAFSISPTEMYRCMSSAGSVTSSDHPGSDVKVARTPVNKYPIIASPGAEQGYVYSTSSSAYPNGGVQDGYYYDQRTTVTSPTAPTNLTYPNPITTPTVTLSWDAATSNTSYNVVLYEVSYSINGGSSWVVDSTTGNTTYNFTSMPAGATSIMFRVRAWDMNNQYGNYVTGTASQVLLAPTLTVPQMVMQGQQAVISWSAVEGADSYTLQRKSSADADWTQVYSGANLSYTETVGTWTSLQYRVQAVFDETPGGWATSDSIQIVSASALVISGTDGDLGTLTSDVQYSVSSDQTSPVIDVTVEVNGGEYASFQTTSGQTYKVGVLDLPTGTGNITITATTTVSESPVTVTRSWTYTKTAQTFPSAGSVGRLTQEGAVVWPETLAEAVRAGTPWGGNLSTALELLKKAALYNRTQTPKYNKVTISLSGKTEGQIIQLPENGKMVEFYVAKLDYESALNGAGRTLVVRKDVYDQRVWDSGNVNAYASSDLDAWFNGTYKNLLDPSIQAAIGTTKFYYTPGNGNNTVSTLERAIFALSLTELGQSHSYANTEGSALPIASTLRIAYRNGIATTQWTRSPSTSNASSAWWLRSNGGIYNNYCGNSNGSRPVFTLPSTFTYGPVYVDQAGGIHDQQEYTPAGDWLDVWGNAIPAVKIETGSYTGTGTYGSSNPTTLTFGFEPKIVYVFGKTDDRFSFPYFCRPGDVWYTGDVTSLSLTVAMVHLTWGDNFVSWYASDESSQLNVRNYQYDYIALG